MIKCIIVDDEPSAVDILKIYVEKIPYLSLQLATTIMYPNFRTLFIIKELLTLS